MAETKYGKYFNTYEYKPGEVQSGGRARISILDNEIMKGSHFYSIHWNPASDTPYGAHTPHIHKDAELIFFIGTDDKNPLDLGAEVEICMGREMEKHIVTQSSVVYIPPNFIHCPYLIRKAERPWIFIQVNQGLRHTEKSFLQLLTMEERAKIEHRFTDHWD